jgi:AcrR family transcriptional regulator
MSDTRQKLITATVATLRDRGIAGISARTIATEAGVNQALVFYHFGTVDELLAAACREASEQRVGLYRERLARVESLSELLDVARDLHVEEKAAGHLAVLGQLLAGAQTQPRLAPATAAGLSSWTEELEHVLTRVLAHTPLSEFVDTAGLAKAVSAGFVGLELYEGVDPQGAEQALAALEQLADLVGTLDQLGPVLQLAARTHLRRLARKRADGLDLQA